MLDFFKITVPLLFANLNPNQKGLWGKLNGQQMVEHLADSFRIAAGKSTQTLMTPEEMLPKWKAFVLSDKEFKPNTVNQLMAEEPENARFSSLEDAIADFKIAVVEFELAFQNQEESTILNPFFGPLNFQEQCHLLKKHCFHHLKQFELLETDAKL
jgi:hypothetical protein